MTTINADILAETGAAIKIGTEGAICWLPKSQIEYFGEVGDIDVEIEMPEWLAEKNDLT